MSGQVAQGVFRDTVLLHTLLGLGNAQDLQGHPMSEFSREGLVVKHIAALQTVSGFFAATSGITA